MFLKCYIFLILELNVGDKVWDCNFLEILNEVDVKLIDYFNIRNGFKIIEEIRVVIIDID